MCHQPSACQAKKQSYRLKPPDELLDRMRSFVTSLSFFLSLLLFLLQPTATHSCFRQLARLASWSPVGTAPPVLRSSMTDSYASSVLSELKDTIKRQASEIEDLQKRLVASSTLPTTGGPKVEPASAGQGHAGHGPPGDSIDELSLYLSKPFYLIATRRVGWLGLFLVSLSLTAVIMSGFEHTLSRQLELAYFVPLLAGHGGNTGGQAVGTVLSAISAGIVSLKDAPRVISKEALSGLTMGIVLGSLVAPIVHFGMGISTHVATVIFCTLPLVSTIAATLGSTIPFACLALGLDPSVIAAPAMTSFVDVSGLLSYFLIAGKVFSHFGVEL